MSVILEFSIAASDFELGQVLMGPPGMHLEIERVVPTGNMVLPFVWATGDDHDEFTEKVRTNPAVREVCVLDSVEDSHLYRIEWDKEATRLIDIIVASDATVLEARGNRDWLFRLRFPDQDTLSTFHANVVEHDVPITVERTFTSTKNREHGYKFGLTDEQREALVLALRRGYFETPSKVSLDELADELDITRQALSNRIRLGNEKVLYGTLLSSSTDTD